MTNDQFETLSRDEMFQVLKKEFPEHARGKSRARKDELIAAYKSAQEAPIVEVDYQEMETRVLAVDVLDLERQLLTFSGEYRRMAELVFDDPTEQRVKDVKMFTFLAAFVPDTARPPKEIAEKVGFTETEGQAIWDLHVNTFLRTLTRAYVEHQAKERGSEHLLEAMASISDQDAVFDTRIPTVDEDTVHKRVERIVQPEIVGPEPKSEGRKDEVDRLLRRLSEDDVRTIADVGRFLGASLNRKGRRKFHALKIRAERALPPGVTLQEAVRALS